MKNRQVLKKPQLVTREKYELDIFDNEWSEHFLTHDVFIGMSTTITLKNDFPIIHFFTFKDIDADNLKCSKNIQEEIQKAIEELQNIKKYLKRKNLPEKYK